MTHIFGIQNSQIHFTLPPHQEDPLNNNVISIPAGSGETILSTTSPFSTISLCNGDVINTRPLETRRPRAVDSPNISGSSRRPSGYREPKQKSNSPTFTSVSARASAESPCYSVRSTKNGNTPSGSPSAVAILREGHQVPRFFQSPRSYRPPLPSSTHPPPRECPSPLGKFKDTYASKLKQGMASSSLRE